LTVRDGELSSQLLVFCGEFFDPLVGQLDPSLPGFLACSRAGVGRNAG
jgi:hypothetical protein